MPGPAATDFHVDFPADWLTEDQAETVLLPIEEVFAEAGLPVPANHTHQPHPTNQAAPTWSPTQLALLNGSAWAMGFMGMFCTGSAVAWTAVLVTFALTLPTP